MLATEPGELQDRSETVGRVAGELSADGGDSVEARRVRSKLSSSLSSRRPSVACLISRGFPDATIFAG